MATEFVFHYEHYPHYMGTQNSESKVDITELDVLSDRYIADKTDDTITDDTIYDDLNEALNGYAQYDIIENWPTIRRSLERKGVWSSTWEEGSHALSMENVHDARSEVGKIEAEIAKDEFDW